MCSKSQACEKVVNCGGRLWSIVAGNLLGFHIVRNGFSVSDHCFGGDVLPEAVNLPKVAEVDKLREGDILLSVKRSVVTFYHVWFVISWLWGVFSGCCWGTCYRRHICQCNVSLRQSFQASTCALWLSGGSLPPCMWDDASCTLSSLWT